MVALQPLDAPPALPGETRAAARQAPSAGLAVVSRDRAAGALVDPTRRRILAALQTPGSATTVAREVGLSRQLTNYHVRALERAGLVQQVGRRPRRGLEERIVRATAAHYLISPTAMGSPGETPQDLGDRFSATYQVAVAARTIHEVAELAARARDAGKRLTTLTLDTSVTFASPKAREDFGNELVNAVNRLVARYHDEQAPDGRQYRLFLGAHPVFHSAPKSSKTKTRSTR
jgi:DNA-binding transcriptional ArsR family regulator